MRGRKNGRENGGTGAGRQRKEDTFPIWRFEATPRRKHAEPDITDAVMITSDLIPQTAKKIK
jgi:hypothetical protein